MDRIAIFKYLKENPTTGRKKLANIFEISEFQSRMLINEFNANPSTDEMTEKQVKQWLKERGLTLDSLTEMNKPKNYSSGIIGKKSIKEFSLGVIADTHLCDKACALNELHDFYNICKKQGVEHIVHAGDLVAGIEIYRGMEFDLTHHGFAAQLDEVVRNYPNIEGITTHIISGNHDLSFKQKAGINIVQEVSLRRDDLKWIGDYSATVKVNGVSIGLHHGNSGVSYATSYKLQKFVEKIGAGQKPQIYVLGHYHSALNMFYRNIHCYLPGCFQKPNDFSVRLGLPNMICGYIVHIKTNGDEHNSIKSINSELISYYD